MIIITHIHICTGRIYLEQKCKGPKTREKKLKEKLKKKHIQDEYIQSRSVKGLKLNVNDGDIAAPGLSHTLAMWAPFGTGLGI